MNSEILGPNLNVPKDNAKIYLLKVSESPLQDLEKRDPYEAS